MCQNGFVDFISASVYLQLNFFLIFFRFIEFSYGFVVAKFHRLFIARTHIDVLIEMFVHMRTQLTISTPV